MIYCADGLVICTNIVFIADGKFRHYSIYLHIGYAFFVSVFHANAISNFK